MIVVFGIDSIRTLGTLSISSLAQKIWNKPVADSKQVQFEVQPGATSARLVKNVQSDDKATLHTAAAAEI